MDQQSASSGASSPEKEILNRALHLVTGQLNNTGSSSAGNSTAAVALAGVEKAELSADVGVSGAGGGCVVITTNRGALLNLMRALKGDSRFDCKLLLDVTVVDWMDKRAERFDVVYHLYSLTTKFRFRIKVPVPEGDPKIDSVVSVWQGANFLEREAWDMYGVTFTGHPDLRRILMYDEFQGYPLRKDYPVQGKQPRIPLRSPEVRNTALDLKRPELVQISRRKIA